MKIFQKKYLLPFLNNSYGQLFKLKTTRDVCDFDNILDTDHLNKRFIHAMYHDEDYQLNLSFSLETDICQRFRSFY